MKFKVSSSLEYTVQFPSTIIFNIHAIRTSTQNVLNESLTIDPYINFEELPSSWGENRYIRLETGDFHQVKLGYNALVDLRTQLHNKDELSLTPIAQLDRNIIPYLFPSRYCQSDRLFRLAYDKFGKISHAFDTVVAITDWINNNVEYVSGSTNSETSAFDTVTQRVGVCRDFAHLGIALCRALSIPARYFGGYAYKLNPPDFHACFEAYLGHKWIIFDATRLVPLNGLIRIATGRDAADAAVATIFGGMQLQSMTVNNEIADNNFEPLFFNNLIDKGICLE